MSHFQDFIVRRNEGSISIGVGIVFLLVGGAVAGAVDYSNAHNRRADLQRAADSAALAGASREDMKNAAIEELARSNLRDAQLRGAPVVVATRDNEDIVRVKITAESPTAMLGILGYDGVEVYAESAAAFVPPSGKIEVALVLDTTESMEDDMAKLRTSAQQLAATLFEYGEENMKVSVVPYAGAVNIGNTGTQMAWMDTAGQAPYHGYAMEGRSVTFCTPPPPPPSTTTPPPVTEPPETTVTPPPPTPPACNEVCGCPGKMACGGGGDGANLSIDNPLKYAGAFLGGLIGTGEADAGPLPYPTPDPNSCPIKNPDQINYFDIYDALPGVGWGGCVEARPAPYDVTDAAPNADGGNTRFVPYFWADESDVTGPGTSSGWRNNFVDDFAAGPAYDDTTSKLGQWSDWKRNNIYKYNDVAATDLDIVETGADRVGPNRACPDPMLPLTDNQMAVSDRIASLSHRNGGGTVISEGLMWGWRALSPGEPFSQGIDYDEETRKIIILMSDGANSVIARNDIDGTPADDTMGDYTAYGFAREFDQKFPSRGMIDTDADSATPYFTQIRDALDDRTLQACSNIKDAGLEDNPVEIYTVLVGDSDSLTAELMATCATTRSDHYKGVSSATQLSDAFAEIVGDITSAGTSRLVN